MDYLRLLVKIKAAGVNLRFDLKQSSAVLFCFVLFLCGGQMLMIEVISVANIRPDRIEKI